jgi:hypothetical protein
MHRQAQPTHHTEVVVLLFALILYGADLVTFADALIAFLFATSVLVSRVAYQVATLQDDEF